MRRLLLSTAVASLVCASLLYAAPEVGPRKHANVARLQGRLVIDGKLDEPAWKSGPGYTGFEKPLGQAERQAIPAQLQTSFHVLYDDDTLYFGIGCNEPAMDKLRVEAARQHDAAMWSDDDVELFLDPVGDRTEYYQVAVNSEATQCDLYYIESGNTNKANYSAEWQAAVFKGPTFWSVEIALPFAMFNQQPSRRWVDNWVFSLSRTRTPSPMYYSQFSPGSRYHDVVNFGTLGPLPVDKARYNLFADNPNFQLQPAAGGYAVTTGLTAENRGAQPFAGTLETQVLAEGSKAVTTPLQLAAGETRKVAVTGVVVAKPGKYPVLFRVRNAAGKLCLVNRFDEWLEYTPLALHLTQPNYRHAIYATQQLTEIKGEVKLGLPLASLAGMKLRLTLRPAADEKAATIEDEVKAATVPFTLPAQGLAAGEYALCAQLLKPAGKQAEIVEQAEWPLRVLPPGPAVEARIDEFGNLLINGVPLFVRGWYGSLQYLVSAASAVGPQLPHSTNFMMGCSEEQATDLGLYTLVGVTNLIDEGKAKLDQPLDEDLKQKLRQAISQARQQRNVIGYYISDEPECRGLSPFFLRSVWEFMAREDPYRFCMIVSRDPARYINSCDVMCPHPYMNPLQDEKGVRKFGSVLNSIHNDISAGVAANDGSKAMWSMPQTFTYGGKYGVNPNFAESRWFTYTSLACGAKGIVPFIFNGYWSHLTNRIAMTYVFEELTLLGPAWTRPEPPAEVKCDNAQVDVIARSYQPRPEDKRHFFLVAANQTDQPAKATLEVPALATGKYPRLLVLRENRVLEVQDGKFTDDFAPLGCHVYTTLEVLPHLSTLTEIEAEIAERYAMPVKNGNLLADPKVKWCLYDWGRGFQSDADLADGILDAAAWLPAYDDRTQCVLKFAQPITFTRVAFYSPTIKSAELDIMVKGQWQTLHKWPEQYTNEFSYKGNTVTTDQLRIRPTANRQGYGSWCLPEITELGLFR